jgi:hypothetical protein
LEGEFHVSKVDKKKIPNAKFGLVVETHEIHPPWDENIESDEGFEFWRQAQVETTSTRHNRTAAHSCK